MPFDGSFSSSVLFDGALINLNAQKNKIKITIKVEVEGKKKGKESARDFWPKQFWLQFLCLFQQQKVKIRNHKRMKIKIAV